jgi:hypothetical protein
MAINLPIISEWNPAGIDKAIADFKKLETKGEKAAFAIKKAAVPAGLAIAAIGTVAFDAVKAFAEDDAAAQKLATTLGNVTGATDKQVAGVEDFITKTSQAAAVADDELRPALDSLVRGTGDITKAQDLLGLALDVSAGTGKDLGAVSDALSKAFNGNLGPLKKLDPALATIIENGGDVDDVFAAMSDTFSGQASTAANTTQGKMKNLGIQMGELKESIGAAVAPLAEKLLPKFLAFAAWIQKNQKLVVTLGAIIAGIAVAIIAVNTAMTIWTAATTAFTAVQAAFNAVMALNPIFLIVAAVVAIIAILVILQKEFGLFDGVIRVVGDAFAAVWAAIKTVFDWVKDNWQLLLVILTGPFGLALAFVITFKDQIIGFIKGVIDWVSNNWKLILGIITGPFGLAFAAILFFKDNVISVFNGLKDLAGTIFNGIGGAFKGVINAVISGLEGGLNFAIKGLNTILDGIDKAAGPFVNFGSIPSVKLPRLAEGGIVTSPTIAMIGEGGEPEAVIPLSKLGSMGVGGGGGNITVNVTSANPDDVVAALQRWVRNNGSLALSTTSGVRF